MVRNLNILYLRWTPSVGGDSGVDLPQCRIVLCAGRQPGWRSTQQSWPCPCFPSLPALQIFYPAPHLNKLEPWHTPSMQKSMMLCFILLFTQSSAPALLSSRQFSATHGAGTALGHPTSCRQLWGAQASQALLSSCISFPAGMDGSRDMALTWKHN